MISSCMSVVFENLLHIWTITWLFWSLYSSWNRRTVTFLTSSCTMILVNMQFCNCKEKFASLSKKHLPFSHSTSSILLWHCHGYMKCRVTDDIFRTAGGCHLLDALFLISLHLICVIQLRRLPEDLAAFPDADGHHPRSEPGPQSTVTWTQRNPRRSDVGLTFQTSRGASYGVREQKRTTGDQDFLPPRGDWWTGVCSNTFVSVGVPVVKLKHRRDRNSFRLSHEFEKSDSTLTPQLPEAYKHMDDYWRAGFSHLQSADVV